MVGKSHMLVLMVLVLALCLAVSACGVSPVQPPVISPIAATATSTRAKPTPLSTSTIGPGDSYASGGFGLSRSAWETTVGPPTSTIMEFTYKYQDGKYHVRFSKDHVYMIERTDLGVLFPTMTFEEAQSEAHAMLPADAVFARREKEIIDISTPPHFDELEFFQSASVATRFDSDRSWGDSPPGEISITYKFDAKSRLFEWIMYAGYNKP